MGPFLISLYIDLPFALSKTHVTMYPDDTAKSLSLGKIEDIADLACPEKWSHSNQLSFNNVKIQAMVVGYSKNERK